MNTIAKILLSVICIVAIPMQQSCRKNTNTTHQNTNLMDALPLIGVYFVALDGISSGELKKLSEDFSKHFADNRVEPYYVTSLDHKASPASCLNDSKTRLSGEKLLKWLKKDYNDRVITDMKKKQDTNYAYYIIGVTDKDISTSVHGRKDYGILGISYLGTGNTGIISTYRLKRKKDLWKLAVHEFCHGLYGCPHCKNEDSHCIMKDAKGGNPKFEIKDSLCKDCSNRCVFP